MRAVADPSVEPTTKAARTRRRIVDAAAHEFAEKGYAGTSLRRIAAAAELKLGSLYFHFESKDDLAAEVLTQGIDLALARLRAAVEALGPDASASDAVAAAIKAHLECLHESGDRGTAVVRMIDTFPDPVLQGHRTEMQRYARYWTTLLNEAQHAGAIDPQLDTRVLRELLFAAMNNALRSSQRSQRRIRQITETLTTLALRAPPSDASDRS